MVGSLFWSASMFVNFRYAGFKQKSVIEFTNAAKIRFLEKHLFADKKS